MSQSLKMTFLNGFTFYKMFPFLQLKYARSITVQPCNITPETLGIKTLLNDAFCIRLFFVNENKYILFSCDCSTNQTDDVFESYFRDSILSNEATQLEVQT